MAQLLMKISKSFGDNYVLKGGTGLLLCHGLDRFSEDIDLDGIRKSDLEPLIRSVCSGIGKSCTVRIAKDTDTVLRYLIDYQSIRERLYPLKLEISFRNKPTLLQNLNKIELINNIRVYSIKDLLNMKLIAFVSRDKARDFYDLYWMSKTYPSLFSAGIAAQLLESLHYKGISEMSEILSEEFTSDHILNQLDLEHIMTDFMYTLEGLVQQP